jgi:hypothetical protein
MEKIKFLHEMFLDENGVEIHLFVISKKPISKCKPYFVTKKLLLAGKLSHTLEAMTYKPKPGELKGNCHEVALCLLIELRAAGENNKWKWITGLNEDKNWEHSWLEYDEWAIDASNTFVPPQANGNPTILICNKTDRKKSLNITKWEVFYEKI